MKKQTFYSRVLSIYKKILIVAVLIIVVLGVIYLFDSSSWIQLGGGYIFPKN
ncbi:hypothetical protein QP615_01495 [Providencia rettgeri]|nr:hypothetical protein [Providencia rettgeri]MDK7743467.1 hypothetical protein [Providencia rettgeri]MDK7756309.1 hypothetical protein [Providencia rettgeri]